MAEIRMTRDDDPDATLPGGVVGEAGLNRTPETDPEHLLPEHAGAGVPGAVAATSDPDVVRDEIERTRARMSQTIDSIESALLRKKEQIEDRLDVTAPVRERVQSQPLLYTGGVFGAALLLGYLTGGKDEDVEEVRRLRGQMARAGTVPTMEVGLGADTAGYAYAPAPGGKKGYEGKWKSRAREWEKQARDLRRACERQEREIRALRASVGGEHRHEEEGRGLMGAVSDGLSGAVAGTVSRLMGGGSRGEMEVEVDLEQPHATYDRPLESREHLYGQARSGYAQPRGEMEAEVELEQPYGTPRPYYGRPAEAPERYYERQARSEMEVEVELEQPRSRRAPTLLGALGVGVAAAVAGAVARLLNERHHEEEMEVEVELEETRRVRPVAYTEPLGYAEYDVAPGHESEMLYERPPEGERYYGGRPASGEMEVEVDLDDRDRGFVDRDSGYRYDNPR